MSIDARLLNDFTMRFSIKIHQHGQYRRIDNPFGYDGSFASSYSNYVYSEPLYQLEMPERMLQKLIDMEEALYEDDISNATKRHYNRSYYERWREQQDYEKGLRRSNEGLQQAYEQYQLLLTLASERRLKQFKI